MSFSVGRVRVSFGVHFSAYYTENSIATRNSSKHGENAIAALYLSSKIERFTGLQHRKSIISLSYVKLGALLL